MLKLKKMWKKMQKKMKRNNLLKNTQRKQQRKLLSTRRLQFTYHLEKLPLQNILQEMMYGIMLLTVLWAMKEKLKQPKNQFITLKSMSQSKSLKDIIQLPKQNLNLI